MKTNIDGPHPQYTGDRLSRASALHRAPKKDPGEGDDAGVQKLAIADSGYRIRPP